MSQIPSPSPRTTEPDTNLSGRQVGDYLLLRRLGKGGMSDVYLAEQISLHRQVAFKILRRDLARDPQYVSRFHHEARAGARLVHANIVQIHHVGEVEGLHFIAQEYVKGMNLKQFLHRNGAIDVVLAIAVMRQVAAALACAAEQGIIHRDIKPENILIGHRGEAKVADFGLARVVDDMGRNHRTRAGVAMGTPLYMSPEQVEGKKVDPRSDLYSFGVTCYEMLAGRPPFDGATALDVAVRHLEDEPAALRELRPDAPAELVTIIRRLMAKRPEDRPTPSSLVRELRQIEVDESEERWEGALAQLDAAPPFAPGSRLEATQQLDLLMRRESNGGSDRKPRRLLLAAGAALMVGGAIGALIGFARPPRDLLFVPSNRRSVVPKQVSVEEQLRYAMRNPSEESFRAVERHWPREESRRNLYYAWLADVHLAETYLRNEEYLLALEQYQGLENVDEQERRFRLVSYAGQGIVLARLRRFGEARELMRRADELLADSRANSISMEPSLLSSEMLAMLADVRDDLRLPPFGATN
jgi:eukaryotic-like serine/threonine-protein kinase